MAKKPVLSAKTLDETQRAKLYLKLEKWHKLQNDLAILRDQEMELRREIAAEYFPDAGEGTNTMVLDYGKVLKLNATITRTVDAAQLEALKITAREKGQTSVLTRIDTLFAYKPSLVTGEWKELSAKDRKPFFDIITEKPGAPSLAIETPKR